MNLQALAMTATEVFEQYGDKFQSHNLFRDAIRIIIWIVLQFLNSLYRGLVEILNSAYKLLTFQNSAGIKQLLGRWTGGGDSTEVAFLMAIAVAVVLGIGIMIMLGFNIKGSDLLRNIIVGIIVIFAVPTVIGTINTALANNMSSSYTNDNSIYQGYVIDLKYWLVDANGAADKYIDTRGIPNGADYSSTNWFDEIDINEVVNGWELDDESSLEDTPGEVFIRRKDGTEINKDDGKKILGIYIDWLTTQYYYRYYFDAFPIFCVQIANILIVVFTFFKVVRLSYEIIVNQLFIQVLAVTDLASGAKLKEALKYLISTYVVLAYLPIGMQIFTTFQSWVNNSTTVFPNTAGGTLGKVLVLIAAAMAVIDGPNLIERIFGIDAGIKSGFHTLMGMMHGARALGNLAKAPVNAARDYAGIPSLRDIGRGVRQQRAGHAAGVVNDKVGEALRKPASWGGGRPNPGGGNGGQPGPGGGGSTPNSGGGGGTPSPSGTQSAPNGSGGSGGQSGNAANPRSQNSSNPNPGAGTAGGQNRQAPGNAGSGNSQSGTGNSNGMGGAGRAPISTGAFSRNEGPGTNAGEQNGNMSNDPSSVNPSNGEQVDTGDNSSDGAAGSAVRSGSVRRNGRTRGNNLNQRNGANGGESIEQAGGANGGHTSGSAEDGGGSRGEAGASGNADLNVPREFQNGTHSSGENLSEHQEAPSNAASGAISRQGSGTNGPAGVRGGQQRQGSVVTPQSGPVQMQREGTNPANAVPSASEALQGNISDGSVQRPAAVVNPQGGPVQMQGAGVPAAVNPQSGAAQAQGSVVTPQSGPVQMQGSGGHAAVNPQSGAAQAQSSVVQGAGPQAVVTNQSGPVQVQGTGGPAAVIPQNGPVQVQGAGGQTVVNPQSAPAVAPPTAAPVSGSVSPSIPRTPAGVGGAPASGGPSQYDVDGQIAEAQEHARNQQVYEESGSGSGGGRGSSGRRSDGSGRSGGSGGGMKK